MVGTSSLLAAATWSMSLLGAVFATPTSLQRRNIPVSLASGHTVTLYRAVYRTTELDNAATYWPLNGSPKDFASTPGDFSAHGGFYMFNVREEAMFWGNQFSINPTTSKGTFAVLEIEYTPSAKCPVQTFTSATPAWLQFLNVNQPAEGAQLPARPTHAIIEGPLSRGSHGKQTQAVSSINGQPLWQYAIVWKECLSAVKIVKVDHYKRDAHWQSQPHVIPKAFVGTTSANEWKRYCPTCTIQ